ncbi:MAG: hypothetical protein AAGF87_18100 [Bacteroidota bacterium]
MSQFEKKSDRPERDSWRRGQLDPNAGEWEAAAARGRELLGSSEDADELLADLDRSIEERFGDQMEEDQAEPSALVRRLPTRWFAIAASLAILISLSWLLLRSPTSVLEDHFVHYDYAGLVNTMGEVETAQDMDAEVRSAIRLYEDRKYLDASVAFGVLSETQREAAKLNFFLAISYLGSDQIARALPILEESVAGRGDDASRFYYALALKASGQSTKADPILQALVEEGGLFAERAHAIIND